MHRGPFGGHDLRPQLRDPGGALAAHRGDHRDLRGAGDRFVGLAGTTLGGEPGGRSGNRLGFFETNERPTKF